MPLLQPLEALFQARFTLGPTLLNDLLLVGCEHREHLIAVLLRELIDLLSLGLAQIETAQLHARRPSSGPPETAPARTARAVTVATPPAVVDPILELRDVTHTYAARTPWAHTALRNVTLTVGRGEGVLRNRGREA